jgi:hypothetical protein
MVNDVGCSFCHRERRAVDKLVIGKGGAAICDACINRARGATEGLCGFCGKRIGKRLKRPSRDVVTVTADIQICGACLVLCESIVESNSGVIE